MIWKYIDIYEEGINGFYVERRADDTKGYGA
jgi:hypothetical protein